jgi:hypothetical protein
MIQMRLIRPVGIAILAPAVLLLGCSDDDGNDGGFTPGENAPPVVNITGPVDGSRYEEGQPIPLRATAVDAEDGALEGESVVWSSDRDGVLASGTEADPANLSVGDHRITVTATDSELATATDAIEVGVNPGPPEVPTASIIQPLAGDVFQSGELIVFLGTADYPGGPNLEEDAFVWTSDVDGPIGVGREVSSNALSLGDHLIVLTVTDPQGLTATAGVLIEIVP